MKKLTMKKSISLLTMALLIAVMLITALAMLNTAGAIVALSRTGGTTGTWNYTLSDGKATNVYCTSTNLSGSVSVPSALDGYPVVSIGGGTITTGVFHGSRTKVTSITIPNSVTTINDNAFYLCKITSMTIPGSVTYIGHRAFTGCSELTTVSIPSSVTTIESDIFTNNYKLQSISVNINNPVYSSENGILFNKDRTALLCMPKKASGAYVIPDSITSIGSYAFSFCQNLTSITIPNSVTIIGDSAFISCTSLSSIDIPDSVAHLGANMFNGSTALTSISLPSNITAIPDYFFMSTGITSMTIPDSVMSIGSYAFSYCANLEAISIPGSIKSVGQNIFNWSGITSESQITYTTHNGITITGWNTAPDGTGDMVSLFDTGHTAIYAIRTGEPEQDELSIVISQILSSLPSTFNGVKITVTQIDENTIQLTFTVITGEADPILFDTEGALKPVLLGSSSIAGFTFKYAQGYQDVEYFENNGIEFDEEIFITENGPYSVYAKDAGGREAVNAFEITNIEDPENSIVILNQLPTIMDVTVPMSLPVSMDAAGNVTVADSASINNGSFGPIEVSSVTISGANDWDILPWSTDYSKEKVDAKHFSMTINNNAVGTDGTVNDGIGVIDGLDSKGFTYDAKVAPRVTSLEGQQIAEVVFVIDWSYSIV
ncbi:MAG: leucine-rich repeat domain-containing protein [Clostridiales bacterium]|nr:leucine-rich repeat domain-containing protein [Clostridiales bacterium]